MTSPQHDDQTKQKPAQKQGTAATNSSSIAIPSLPLFPTIMLAGSDDLEATEKSNRMISARNWLMSPDCCDNFTKQNE
jgi:hypothetical protein